MSKHSLGRDGEDLAARFLEQRGFRIIERNCRKRIGEIDIVAADENDLVFVEVKTRSSADAGDPLESITPRKQATLRRLATIYSQQKPEMSTMDIRFDCIGIIRKGDHYEINHVRDAF